MIKTIPNPILQGLTSSTINRGGPLGGGSDPVSEFDVDGATYYAVAPTGHTYSAEQTTNYSTRKYNTLSAAYAALTTAPATPRVINMIGDWTGVTDTTGVTFLSSAMNTETPANYTLVRGIGDARCTGLWDAAGPAYRLDSTTGTGVYVRCAYLRLDGLQFTGAVYGTSSGVLRFAPTGDLTGDFRFSNLFVKNTRPNVGNAIMSINTRSGDTFRVWNCILSSRSNGMCIRCGDGTISLNSCTFAQTGTGGFAVYKSSGTLAVTNCYASNVTYATFNNGVTSIVTTATSDTDGTAGLQNIPYTTDTFIGVTNDIENLNPAGGSPLLGAGTDTTGEDAPLNFDRNIAGDVRSSWNVGAF